ncbi:MAG: rRNA maturation RNase YbeY [Cyanobacteria bacterium P01_D01_bin.44]
MVDGLETVQSLDRSTAQITLEVWQDWFKRWLAALSPQLSPINAYELSLVLIDDAGIQQLNQTYRHQDKPTDVLAFAALETALPGHQDIYQQMPLNLGDIIISVDTAVRQASEQGHSVKQELTWLASHGLLHLLGWDHPDEASLQGMLAEQTTLLMLIS